MAGTSYTRQSTLTDGDTITAALFNDEYNKLVSAFAYTTTGTTGHQHDGGAAEGGNIHTIGDQNFLNKIVVDSSNNRWGVFVEVGGSAVEQIRIQDGAIVPVTDSDIDLGTSSLEFKDGYFDGTIHVDTLDVDANATIAGTLGVTGNTTVGGTLGITGNTTIGGTLVVTGTTTLNGGTLTLGDAASDNVVFGADVNSNIIPNTDSAFDLGSSSQEWRDLYLDGTAHIDTLDVDVNATIAGTLGVTGVLTASSLDISGDIDVDGTTNLDVVDIDGAVDMASTLAVAGIVTANAGVKVDNITIDGTEIDSSGALTLDVAGNITLDADGGTVTFADAGSSLGTITSSGYSGTAAVATTVTITDNENTNENNAIVFTAGGDLDGGNLGLESDGDLYYNPSTSTLTVPNVSVSGTFTTVNSVTMDSNNAVIFEGSTADAHETTLTSVDATADRTITLPNVSGTVPVLAVASNTQITSTPEELNALDGITAVVGELNALDIGSTAVGTAVASKAVILDSNKDYTGIRNLTITGELDAATLDVSGAIDVAGTTNLDVVDIDGAVDISGNLNMSGSGLIRTTDGSAANPGIRIGVDNDNGIYRPSNNTIGFSTAGTERMHIDAAGIDVTGTVTATGTSVFASLDISGDIDVDGTTNLDVVDIDGAVDMASTLAVAGVVTANAGVVVDNITIDGTQIDLSSGDLTLDVAGLIVLDAGNQGVVQIKDDGTVYGTLFKSGSNFFIESNISDGDISFRGSDGGSNVTALTLDMSAAGAATFNAAINVGGTITGDDGLTIDGGAGNAFLSVGSNTGSWVWKNYQDSHKLALEDSDGTGEVLNFSTSGVASFSNNIVTSSGKVIVGSTSSVFTNSIISATSSTGPVVGAQSTAAAHYAGGFHNTASGAVDLVAFYTGSGALAGSIETGSSGEFIIESSISDKDLVFKGNDGGSAITALTLDMSTGGTAYFGDDVRLTDNHAIRLGTDGDIVFYHDNSNGYLENGTGNLTLDVTGVIVLDADNAGVIQLKDGGTHYGSFFTSSDALNIQSNVNNGEMLFKGVDGGSGITALTLDMSAAGAATFNAGVFAGSASSFPSIKINNNSYIGSANNATAIQIATSGAVTFSSAITALSASTSVVTAYLANSNSSIANSASSILYLQTSGDAAIQDGYKMVTFADSDTVLGSISTAATSSNVAYNTSSDERLKENIVDMPSQLANILKVQPRQFDWKKHGNTSTGFIAQELHKTYPEAVSVGLEDEKKNPWSVDYGRLTPYIIKAMQEQQTLIESLTARITALEE